MALLNENDITIVIKARDEASNAIKKLTGSIENMGPMFDAMAKAGTVAFTAIGGAAAISLKAADESMKVQAQLGAVLKSTGNSAGLFAEDILDQAAALQKQTTFSDEAITSGANLLLTFKNIKGAVFQEALPALLDMSTAMGQDLKSSAIQVGKALNDPIAGISALSRVGVTFSKEQEEVIAKLVETGNTAAAQRIIIEELNSEFGGSAAAAAQTFGGQIEQLKISLGDIGEEIGMILIPWIQQLTASVKPVIDSVIAWIKENPELVKNIITTTIAVTGLVAAIGLLGLLLPVVVSGFTLLFSPVSLILLAMTALGAALIVFRDKFSEILAVIEEKTGFVTLFKWAWDQVSTTFTETLIPALISLWEALKPLEPVLSFIAKVIGGVLVVAVWAAVTAITGWIQIFTNLIALGAEVSAVVVKHFTEPIQFFIDVVKDAVSWVSKLLDKMSQIGGDIGGKVKSKLGFEHGGIIPGAIGQPVPIIAHGGERVIPASRANSGGSGSYTININNPVVSDRNDLNAIKSQIELAMRDVVRNSKLSLA